MRITSGLHRGRTLFVPKGQDIRPTSDKVRQAVFNILYGYDGLPGGAIVLDAFCGTGALGLEALSRGASFCTFFDKAPDSIESCRHNIEALGAGAQTNLLRKDAVNPGVKAAGIAPASLAFFDPPYRQNLVAPALVALVQGGWLAPGAMCVAEREKEAPADALPGLSLLDRRCYGDTQILFYRCDRGR